MEPDMEVDVVADRAGNEQQSRHASLPTFSVLEPALDDERADRSSMPALSGMNPTPLGESAAPHVESAEDTAMEDVQNTNGASAEILEHSNLLEVASGEEQLRPPSSSPLRILSLPPEAEAGAQDLATGGSSLSLTPPPNATPTSPAVLQQPTISHASTDVGEPSQARAPSHFSDISNRSFFTQEQFIGPLQSNVVSHGETDEVDPETRLTTDENAKTLMDVDTTNETDMKRALPLLSTDHPDHDDADQEQAAHMHASEADEPHLEEVLDLIPITPASFALRLTDATIDCTCPHGAQRLAKDLVMISTKSAISWMHLPCKPYSDKSRKASESRPTLQTTGSIEDIGDLAVPEAGSNDAGDSAGAQLGNKDLVNRISTVMGPTPSTAMIKKARNFATKFICDGPCEDSEKKFEDFFLCKKCLAWQHDECMLYGEEGDCGGPVCNHCYMAFLAHRDEIVKWQRQRLMEALQEATMFLTDPDTSHEVWRREWLKKFLRRFFAANKGLFVKFVLTRRAAQQASRQQSAREITYVPQAENKNTTPLRPERPKRNSATKQAMNEDGEQDDVKDNDVISIASSDNIIVRAPGTKSTKRAPREQPKKRSHKRKSSDTEFGKKRSHKRKRPLSPPDLMKSGRKPAGKSNNLAGKSNNLVGSQTPRKSVRMSEVLKPMYNPDDYDHDEDEDFAELIGKKPTKYAAEPDDDDDDDDDFGMLENMVEGERRIGRAPTLPMDTPKPASKRNGRKVLPAAVPDTAAQHSLDDAMIDEIHQLSSTVLWREYLSLPSPDGGDAMVATQSRRPPPDWLAECELRFGNMLTAAGPEEIKAHLETAFSAFPRQSEQVLKSLTDMAHWIVRKGPWRGKRAELGILAEVLGLDDKVRYWKGGGF